MVSWAELDGGLVLCGMSLSEDSDGQWTREIAGLE